MRITREQEKILESLVCQRLTMDPGNKTLVRSFENKRNRGLAEYLKTLGWKEDSEGATTFYVIKNQENKILLFFSLKCGTLFDPLDPTELKAQIEKLRTDLDVIRRSSRSRNQPNQERILAEQIRMEYGIPQTFLLESHLASKVSAKKNLIWCQEKDQQDELNPNISQVVRTYPAVELVHFCANDEARKIWKRYKFGRSMGQVLFWWFVAPLISDIRKTLGCQYVYLFAADDSDDGRLVNYYEVSLNFQQRDDIGANKPHYDFFCAFMCQKIEDLPDVRYDFLENFNPAPDDIVV